jgi:N-acetylmuramoyl-L-alanine amidase
MRSSASPAARLVLAMGLLAVTVATASAQDPATVRDVRRDVYRDLVRITIELDQAVPFQHERLDAPARVVLDFGGTVGGRYANGMIEFDDDVVRAVHVGLHDGPRTRVVLDLLDADGYTVYATADPHRVIVDVTRTEERTVRVVPRPSPFPTPRGRPADALPAAPTPPPPAVATAAPAPAPVATTGADTDGALEGPATNIEGGFSMSRQLGLGVSRIVIDPGHGGRDPGSIGHGLVEKEVVLDIALRLEALLADAPGIDVVLTRHDDTYPRLEERTAFANREQADLFLSIHANSSEREGARGIETFFLNFARDADAEALAARENAGSAQSMRSLPDIVQAITLNNKLDESREFATMVHRSMHTRLSAVDRAVEDRGVKQAPFVVLIGATMPSVLAEVSFLTNAEEANLLRTDAYRQQIAEALRDGVLQYVHSLHLGVIARQ